MSEEEVNGSQVGHPDGIDDINSVYNPSHAGEMGGICIPQADGNAIFECGTLKKKILTQMELLQEHMMENVEKPKGICGVFRVEKGSSSDYSRPGENQGWNSKRYEEVSTHAIYNRVGIKVGTIIRGKSKEDTIKIGPSNVTIGEGRRTMKRTTLTLVRAQN
uniref:Uncharacterized protein n=1 Tax=Solanum tuberosum TaxID=4113 RepID=M1DG32_SOLTU